MSFSDFDEARRLVKQAGGVLTVSMQQLRDAIGAGRLGPQVAQSISRELAARGLRHWPRELPHYQWNEVRLYQDGTGLAAVIDLLDRFGPDEDAELVELTMSDAQARLEQIRKLVC